MKLPASFRIEGKDYSREDLVNLAGRMVSDAAVPAWKSGYFAFIRAFLEDRKEHLKQESSGTTGKAKSFLLESSSMILSAKKTLAYFGLKINEPVLACLPVDYIAGKMMIVRALAGGLDLHFAEPSGTPLKDVSGSFRFSAMVPLQLAGTISAGHDAGMIDELLIGGGEIHPDLAEEIRFMDKPAVYESFAMTETLSHFALRRINGPAPEREFSLMEGISIRADERGCLKVDVPGITQGPVQSNDLVELRAGGEKFIWLGRADNLINSGGIKIIPEILEASISKLLGKQCLLLAEDDFKLGQRLVLLVEDSGKEGSEGDWASLLKASLSAHEVPKRILSIQEIPRNASFKADRNAARKFLRH